MNKRTATNRTGPSNKSGVPDGQYVDYLVEDPRGQKIGRVKEFFTNARGKPEYVMVRVGLFGLRSVLIPVGFVTADEQRRTLTLQ